jgi:isoleucyl-tRNA synthetase
VHLALFPEVRELGSVDPAMMEDWQTLLEIRDIVLKALEAERKAGKIGKGLEAKVKVVGTSENLRALRPYADTLKELLNVSQVSLGTFHIEATSPQQFSVTEGPEGEFHAYIYPAEGHKCERCWNYYADDSPQHVRQFGSWPNVCGRCAGALRQMGYSETAQ